MRRLLSRKVEGSEGNDGGDSGYEDIASRIRDARDVRGCPSRGAVRVDPAAPRVPPPRPGPPRGRDAAAAAGSPRLCRADGRRVRRPSGHRASQDELGAGDDPHGLPAAVDDNGSQPATPCFRELMRPADDCPLRLGTRGSPLALAQADRIARQLRERCGRTAVMVTVATPGDESTAPIERLGTTGGFTTTLREALLRGAGDLVRHPLKDLPTAPVPGLQVAAFPAREDPRDALIWPGGTGPDALPHGARIGTGSPRRAALLRATGRQLAAAIQEGLAARDAGDVETATSKLGR